jgi:hypothetical protein
VESLELSTVDTAAWGIILFTWQKEYTLRRPQVKEDVNIDAQLKAGSEHSKAVKEVLSKAVSPREGFEKAFRPDGNLSSLWDIFVACVYFFNSEKKGLVLSVWEDLTAKERSIRAPSSFTAALSVRAAIAIACVPLNWRMVDLACRAIAVIACLPYIPPNTLNSLLNVCAVLEGEVTQKQKDTVSKMELSNSLLDVCHPQYWKFIRQCSHADIEPLLATGGVLLPGSVKKIVAVWVYIVHSACY